MWMSSTRCVLLAALCFASVGGSAVKAETPAANTRIDFARDVRPILSDRLLELPRARRKRRGKAKLRLDRRDAGATARSEAGRAPRRRSPGRSQPTNELVTRDRHSRRRPACRRRRAKEAADAARRGALRRWIEQGADVRSTLGLHRRRAAGQSRHRDPKSHNPIDPFVLARLEGEGLRTLAEADRATLLRRVTLDLTGLPPTPRSWTPSLADARPDAYEKVVDRLLASPRLGERMAMPLARRRPLRRHQRLQQRRDAHDVAVARLGDRRLQPQPAVRPVHHRATRRRPAARTRRSTSKSPPASTATTCCTTEGGIIDEEYRVEYVADRVHTTATVFLGLSMQCARCHDHKYDPLHAAGVLPLLRVLQQRAGQSRRLQPGHGCRAVLKVPSRRAAGRTGPARRTAQPNSKPSLQRARSGRSTPSGRWEKPLSPDEIAQAGAGRTGRCTSRSMKRTAIRRSTASTPTDAERSRPGDAGRRARSAARWSSTARRMSTRRHVGAFEQRRQVLAAAWVYPTSATGPAF